MQKIKVLIVDDSVVIRRLLANVLDSDPHIEVVGTAPDGKIALAKIAQLNPDLVTLDIEMPVMDGLETLPELKALRPNLPVIMFSTLSTRGAEATFQALELGASDYVAKPANVGSVSHALQVVRDELVPKVKALCRSAQSGVVNSGALNSNTLKTQSVLASSRGNSTGGVNAITKFPARKRKEVLVIGSSTGGPQALAAVLSGLPGTFPLPIAIAQHMPPVFTKSLAARLNQNCALEVVESAGGETMKAGCVYIAPGDFHLHLKKKGASFATSISQGPRENSCRPAVDVLFRSAAEIYGAGCLALVLTGMGQDGLIGCTQVVEAGGAVIAQDEQTSVVWGMPRAVSEAQLAAEICPLQDIAQTLSKYASHERSPVPQRSRA